MVKIISFLTLFLFLITSPSLARFHLELEFSAISNLGPLLHLHHEFVENMQRPPDNDGFVIQSTRAKAVFLSSENLEIFLAQRNSFTFNTSKKTVDYLLFHLREEEQKYPEGEFFLKTENIKTMGPGITLKKEWGNYNAAISTIILPFISFEQRKLLGTIDEESGYGGYSFFNSDHSPSGFGFTTDFFLQKEKNGQLIALNLKNLLSYLYWKEIFYEFGQFRYRDYDYTDDGYKIMPPLLRGTRHLVPLSSRLPLEGKITLGWEGKRGLNKFTLNFPRPVFCKFAVAVNENLLLTATLPQKTGGILYEKNDFSFQLWADTIFLHKIQNLGGSLSFNFGF